MRRRIIVFGSRNFNDYQLLEYKLDRILVNSDNVTIISGCARGADRLGERYATRKGYGLIRIPAQWDIYGSSSNRHIIRQTRTKIERCWADEVGNQLSKPHLTFGTVLGS